MAHGKGSTFRHFQGVNSSLSLGKGRCRVESERQMQSNRSIGGASVPTLAAMMQYLSKLEIKTAELAQRVSTLEDTPIRKQQQFEELGQRMLENFPICLQQQLGGLGRRISTLENTPVCLQQQFVELGRRILVLENTPMCSQQHFVEALERMEKWVRRELCDALDVQRRLLALEKAVSYCTDCYCCCCCCSCSCSGSKKNKSQPKEKEAALQDTLRNAEQDVSTSCPGNDGSSLLPAGILRCSTEAVETGKAMSPQSLDLPEHGCTETHKRISGQAVVSLFAACPWAESPEVTRLLQVPSSSIAAGTTSAPDPLPLATSIIPLTYAARSDSPQMLVRTAEQNDRSSPRSPRTGGSSRDRLAASPP